MPAAVRTRPATFTRAALETLINTVSPSQKQAQAQGDEPDRPRDVGDRDDGGGDFPARYLVRSDELKAADQERDADGSADPAEPRRDGGCRHDRGRGEDGPRAREQIAQVLADADTQEPMQRREHDLDRLPRGRGVRALGGPVATGELGYGERPADEAQCLDQGR